MAYTREQALTTHKDFDQNVKNWEYYIRSYNGGYEGYNGAGVYPVAESHNAFRLYPQNASNADNGTISLYGIKEY